MCAIARKERTKSIPSCLVIRTQPARESRGGGARTIGLPASCDIQMAVTCSQQDSAERHSF